MKVKYRRLLTVFISICVIISSLPPFAVYAQSADEIETISSEADLSKLSINPDGNFVLTADISLTATFAPISNFSGVLDGQGHTITNLSLTASTNLPTVAFILNNSGVIKNLAFTNVSITGINTEKTNWAAAIAGTNTGSIEGCYVKGTIAGAYRSAAICAHNSGTIKNCYAVADVSAKVECAEIVAVSEAGSLIDSCYAVPQVQSDVNNSGAITAYAYTGATIQNCVVFAGSVSNGNAENLGLIAGRLKTEPTFSQNISSANALLNGVAVTDGTSTNKNGLTVSEAELLLQSTYEIDLGWDFAEVWKMDTALGRPVLRVAEEQPSGMVYMISDVDDLELLRMYGQISENKFILSNDIALSGNFNPISTFAGTLDGNGYTITGLTIQASEACPTGAFILNNTGVIENIGFTEAVVFGIQTDQSNWASVIVGTNNGVIRRAYVLGNISGGHRSSAIVSWNNNVVEDCYCVATIAGKVETGGIAAVTTDGSLIKNCYVVPKIYSTNNNTGGISAYAYTGATIKNCCVLGGLIENGGTENIARIVGRLNGTPTLINNLVSENALLQDTLITSESATSSQGQTMERTVFSTENVYSNTLGWDFDDCWEMNAILGRPVLIGLEELENNRYIYDIISDSSVTITPGVTRRAMEITDVNGNRQAINIIEVDLSLSANSLIVGTNYNAQPPVDSDGNYIRYVDDEGHDTFKGTLAEQISTTRAEGINVVAGVNGEFYTQAGPEGYMIKDGGTLVNGTRISTDGGAQYPFHGFLGITNSGLPVIGTYDDDWENLKNDLYQATGGQYIIVENGSVQHFADAIECNTSDISYDQETFYRYVSRHPRTAAGIKDDSTVMLVTVDGRGYNNSVGVYIEELGLLMRYLGADTAINMDGGGSTTAAFYNDAASSVDVLNVPSNTSGVSYQNKTLRSIFSTVLVVVDAE